VKINVNKKIEDLICKFPDTKKGILNEKKFSFLEKRMLGTGKIPNSINTRNAITKRFS
jgi:hypothetical protein